jgi:hypothetical protein
MTADFPKLSASTKFARRFSSGLAPKSGSSSPKEAHELAGVLEVIGFAPFAEHRYLQQTTCSFLQVMVTTSDLKQAAPDCNGYGMRPVIRS